MRTGGFLGFEVSIRTLAASHKKELGVKACNLQVQNLRISTSMASRLQQLIRTQFSHRPQNLNIIVVVSVCCV